MSDFYQVLEVSKTATSEEINASYKKLAMKWHPDRHQNDEDKEKATAKFKLINEAFATLNDPQKRRNYDLGFERGSSHGFGGFGGFGGFSSIFGNFFDEEVGVRGNHIVISCQITLEEAFSGCDKEVSYMRKITCNDCNGIGGKLENCNHCHGCGYEELNGGHMRVMRPCSVCEGLKQRVVEECKNCFGTGTKGSSNEVKKISIPAGVHHGMNMTFRGNGGPGKFGGDPGDLVINIIIEPHKLFKRNGNDIYYELPVTYTQLVFGCNLEVPSFNNVLNLKIPPGTQPLAKFRMRGEGMPVMRKSTKGDLYVVAKLEIPQDVNEETKQLLEKLAKLETK